MIRRSLRGVSFGALLLGVAACSSDKLLIPSYNAPDVAGVGADPNGLQLLATGVTERERALLFATSRDMGLFGREAYYYFPTDFRYVSNYLIGISTTQAGNPEGKRLDPGGFASGIFFERYRNMRNAVNVQVAVANSTLPAADKNAMIGFAKTHYALDLLYLIESRDTVGAVVEIDAANPNANPPYVSRDSVYKRIAITQGTAALSILDSALLALNSAGATFPVTLHAGYSGFNTPATFKNFTNAIKARAAVEYAATLLSRQTSCTGVAGTQANCQTPYRRLVNGNSNNAAAGAVYQTALAALTAIGPNLFGALPSGVNPNNDVGVYALFSTVSGDVQNSLNFNTDVNLLAHASFVDSAQAGDARLSKVTALSPTRAAPGTGLGIPATYRFNIYASGSTKAPIIRNEELYLLRAEANWFATSGSKAQAIADLNTVRTQSGGLAPYVVATALTWTDQQFIDALLYERKMSLVLENRKWVDYRRFGRLLDLPRDQTSGTNQHFRAALMPLSTTECNARAGTTNFPTVCSQT